MNSISLLLGLIVCTITYGCGASATTEQEEYKEILQSTVKEIPDAVKFSKLFPNTVFSYSHFSDRESRMLHGNGTIYDRYLVKFSCRVVLDAENRVQSAYNESFLILEVTEVKKLGSGATDITNGDNFKISPEDFRKLDSLADFEKLHIHLDATRPVENFVLAAPESGSGVKIR